MRVNGVMLDHRIGKFGRRPAFQFDLIQRFHEQITVAAGRTDQALNPQQTRRPNQVRGDRIGHSGMQGHIHPMDQS